MFLNTIIEHWICSSGSTDKHTRSVLLRNAARLNLQFDMLYLNAGFALAVRMMNTARWSYRFHREAIHCFDSRTRSFSSVVNRLVRFRVDFVSWTLDLLLSQFSSVFELEKEFCKGHAA